MTNPLSRIHGGSDVGKKKKASTPEADSSAGFEESLGELQQIVARLEDGSLPLEESMLQFEQGVGLLRQCYQVLEAAEQRIEILTGADREGNPKMAPFDGSATFDSPAASRRSRDEEQPPAAREDSLF